MKSNFFNAFALFSLLLLYGCNHSEIEKLSNKIQSNRNNISDLEKSNLEIDVQVEKLNHDLANKLSIESDLKEEYEKKMQPVLFRTQEEKDYELSNISQRYNEIETETDSIHIRIKNLQDIQIENRTLIEELETSNDGLQNQIYNLKNKKLF
ncbi:hypothetical protein [Chryseobacterium sp. EO14]|uniref:hypothetical protein n=1 Tax=Chryseobacterium sp. EO14 TaxID=2950551 RepID=UPI002108886A|nr:hypothetical protein [Chryseobacterium sp. EO14]MCQ4141619.1 hypothetical protein [Chryseobacterium sp. EO14]